MFNVVTSKEFQTHTSKNEWVFDSGCTHHMEKDSSLFSSLNKVIEKDIYVVDDFSLDIIGHSDMPCWHGHIFNVYHVPNLSENMLSVSQLTQTGKVVEF